MTFGNYVLFNLLVAILVEGFSKQDELFDYEVRKIQQKDAIKDYFNNLQKGKPVDKQESAVSKSNNVDIESKNNIGAEINEGQNELGNVYNKSNAVKGSRKIIT